MIPEKTSRGRRWLWRIFFLFAVVAAAGVVTLYIKRPPPDERFFRKGIINQRAGRSAQAAENFRKSLELKPDRMDVRTALIKAERDLRAFPEALAELDIAVQKGMNKEEATLLRASIFSSRAVARMREAGKTADPALCDRVLAEDVRPAVALVQGLAASPDTTLAVYVNLGDLHLQEAAFLIMKRTMLTTACNEARKLKQKEEAAAKSAQALAVVPEINATEKHAVEAYARAMEKDPKAPAPRLAIARLVLGFYSPNVAQARALLEPILKDNPTHRPTLLLLVRAERAAGNLDKALEIVRRLRADAPEDSWLMLTELDLLVKAEKWAEAGPLSETVAKRLLPRQSRGTDRVQASLAEYCRGQVLLHESRPVEAANCLQDIFTADPIAPARLPRARVLLAQALEATGNREQAISNYRKVLIDVEETASSSAQLDKEAREAQYQACLALVRNLKGQDMETVSECAAAAVRIYPLRSEVLDAAREAYRASHYTKKDFADLVIVRATALGVNGQLGAALGECRKELETGTNSMAAKARLRDVIARILVAQGAFQEASAVYEQLWHEFPVRMGYGQELAGLKVRLGQTAEARKIYESLIEADPSDIGTLRALVGLLVHTGDLAAARALVARSEPQLGADMAASMLTELAVREGRLDDAVSIARERAKERPDDPAAQVALAELLWRRGDLAGARAAFDAAIKAKPAYGPAYRRGLLDLEEDRAADAVSLYRGAISALPSEFSLRLHLAVALQASGNSDEAIALLEKLLVNVRRPMAAADASRWVLAVMEAGRGRLDSAISHNSLIYRGDLGFGEDREELLKRLAALGAPARAEAAKSLTLLPTFIVGLREPPALKQMEALQKLLPGEAAPECWYAAMLSRAGKQVEAMQRFDRALAQHPNSVLVLEMIADCQERSGNLGASVQMLEKALQYASAQHGSWLQLRLGQLYERMGDLDRAITSFRNAMSAEAWAPLACNNLAYLLATEKNDLVSALPLAQQAARLGKGMPEFQDTLGWIYYLSGDMEKAVAALELARTGLPTIPSVRYHLGMAYLKSNRRDDAKAQLREAIGLSRDFPEAAEAQRVLKDL